MAKRTVGVMDAEDAVRRAAESSGYRITVTYDVSVSGGRYYAQAYRSKSLHHVRQYMTGTVERLIGASVATGRGDTIADAVDAMMRVFALPMRTDNEQAAYSPK